MEQKSGWTKFLDGLVSKNLDGLAKLLVEIVTLFDTKRKAAIQVFVLGVVVYLYLENKDLNKSRVDDLKISKNSEIRIYERVIERLDPEFKEIKKSVDSSNARLDSAAGEIKPVVSKLKEKLNLK